MPLALVTDSRGRQWQGALAHHPTHCIHSASPTGPYTDESGAPMLSGGGTQILATHGNVIGPGGQSVMHDTDGDLLVYHYYAANQNGTPALADSERGPAHRRLDRLRTGERCPLMCAGEPPLASGWSRSIPARNRVH